MFHSHKSQFAAMAAVVLGVVSTIPPAGAQIHVNLALPDGARQDAWIEAASDVAIRFRERPESTIFKDVLLKDVDSIYFFEPQLFSEAMALFEGRRYAEALPKFQESATANQAVAPLHGNYGALARFYAMECQRKLGNIEDLMKIREGFDKARLVRQTHQDQVDLYTLWDAVARKSWDRAEKLASDWLTREELPTELRAQAVYCQAVALEQLDRKKEALHAYASAMVVGGNREETIARDAALGALRIQMENPLVQRGLELHGTDGEVPGSAAFSHLMEAASLAHLYQTRLASGRPLPEEFQPLLKVQLPERPTPEAPVAVDEEDDDQSE